MAGPRVELDDQGKPVFIETVSADELRRIKPTDVDALADLYNYLDVYSLDNLNERRKFEEQYLARFNLTPDNPRYADALAQLASESNSQRVMVAQARRAAQVTETNTMLGGETAKKCVYINDGPDPCDNCLALNGLEKTYAEFANDGELPGDRCLGGDNCLCILVPIN